MSLFQRIRDDFSKGYREAANGDTPTVLELQALRQRIIGEGDDSPAERGLEGQTTLRQELSEIDKMIARANRKATGALAS